MQYRKLGNTGCEISALGFGTMRLPTTDHTPGSANIDQAETTRLIRYAIDHGVNYIDTAYNYHGGQSEVAVGKALADGYRERTCLATKSPVWLFEKPEDFDTHLEEQLTKLQTDHVDFYLLHALNRETWENKVKKLELYSRMKRAKEAGKIRFMGFSFHDELSLFKEIVDAGEWDFCQIQYNYINVDYQAGHEGLLYAAGKGLGVIIMEPLLGGRLAVAPEQVAKILPEGRSAVEWAFDYLWDQPQVSLLLSGMGTMEMVEENIVFAEKSHTGMVPDEEKPLYGEAKKVFDTMAIVPCTQCGYCMPCPFGVDIPHVYDAYNKTASLGMKKARPVYEALAGKADLCKSCGRCEEHCPQHIRSAERMPEIAKAFAPQKG